MARAVGDKRQSPTQRYSCRAHVIALTFGAETKFPSCSMTGTGIAEAAKMLAQTDAIPLSVVGEPRDPAVAHWMAVACCPSCGSTTRMAEATLPDGLYAFGTERRAALDVMRYAGDLLKTALYFVTGAQYAGIAHVFGKQGNQPWYPFARDHFQACLVRE